MKINKEYIVIVRPFYREQEPFYINVLAKDEKEAHDMAIKDRDVKETLEAVLVDEFEWNEQEIEKYWKLYR